MQLRNVVELAGMVRHCDFAEQSSLGGDEVTLRPDLIVNLPGGKQVVVDAKAPLQGVLDAYQARDEAEREQHLRDHARLLRKHVKSLADKAYWAGLDTTPDFVVMFLPGEHLYGAALEVDPTLIEEAMARRVLIATPTTLLAACCARSPTAGSRSVWPSQRRRSPTSGASCTRGWSSSRTWSPPSAPASTARSGPTTRPSAPTRPACCPPRGALPTTGPSPRARAARARAGHDQRPQASPSTSSRSSSSLDPVPAPERVTARRLRAAE